MNKSTVARRYAKALFLLLDASAIDSVRHGLSALVGAIHESHDLKHIVASPVFTVEEKIGVLAALGEKTGAPPLVKDFLRQLLKKNRVGVLAEIAQAFGQLADERLGKHHIVVTSAQSLPPVEQEWLRSELGTLTTLHVELVFQTDPALIAGVHIRIGSKVYDSSVRGRLEKMRSLLLKG